MIREVDAVIELRVNEMMDKGLKPPFRVTVSEHEWAMLNDGVIYQTTMDCDIKWNDSVVVINPNINEQSTQDGSDDRRKDGKDYF
jgi:hypothetical protein